MIAQINRIPAVNIRVAAILSINEKCLSGKGFSLIKGLLSDIDGPQVESFKVISLFFFTGLTCFMHFTEYDCLNTDVIAESADEAELSKCPILIISYKLR